jgi:CubicO group peptidase (beta-lactamase class C family)
MNDRKCTVVANIRATATSLLLAASLAPVVATATNVTTLPDSPVGRLGGELIQHINHDTPARIRQWAPSVLSASMAQDDKDAFLTDLGSAARESGGVDIFDARPDPHQPGLLQLVLKARRDGRLALLFLTVDPAQPGKLAQAEAHPMDDPGLYAAWPKTSASPAQMTQAIHATLDRLVRTDDFSGCVTVMKSGQTLFDECRGVAERNFGARVDRNTKFHVGSIGKMFTAVAIAQLVEAGKLSWDDTLATWVPEYPDQQEARKITVWQLLHHTSGLGDFMVPEYFQHRDKYLDPLDYLGLIARQPVMGEPGRQSIYSNAGYVLLGRIVENVSHEGYFDYMQRHVFAPAGMTATGFDKLDDVTPDLAVGYYHDGVFAHDWKADWMLSVGNGSPAGGSYSTDADLLRFASALREGRLLKPATLQKIFADEVPAGPGGYAAGFGDRLSHHHHIRGHQGGIEGTTANLQMVWEAHAAVALTSNEGPTQTWLLAEQIADLLAADDQKP